MQSQLHEPWQSVTWQPGWVTLLYGANGAGKTTWLRQLAASWAPVYYSGHTLGWIPHLTVADNIRLWGKAYDAPTLSSSRDLQDRGDLLHQEDCRAPNGARNDEAFNNTPWGDLSQGQKQYVAFLGAKASGCKLWLMDEPFAHMDASYTEETQHMCCEHCENGGALVLTSHIPSISFWPHVHTWNVIP